MNFLKILLAVFTSLPALAQIGFSLKVTNTNCLANGGKAKVVLSAGVLPQNVSYRWSNGSNADSINNLAAGNYAVTVFNATKSDSVVKNFTIDDAATLNVMVSPYDTICTGTNAILQVSAEPSGGTFTWSGGDLQAPRNKDTIHVQPKVEQIYTVTYNNVSCPGSTSVRIVASPVKAQIAGVTQPTCGLANGSINGAGSGFKANFSWLKDGQLLPTSASILSNLKAGNYTFIVFDAVTGCSDTIKNIALADNTTYASVTAIETTPDSCLKAQGSAKISVSGGSGNYTFKWSHSNTLSGNFATKLSKGNYSVTVSDGVCTPFDTTVIILGPDSVIKVVTNTVNDNCSNSTGSATALATGGNSSYAFDWSNGQSGSSIANLLGNNYYTVTVTDFLGCTATAIAFVSDVPAPSVNFLPFDSLCPNANNGSLKLNISGGQPPYQYQWQHDASLTASFANSLAPGFYEVTVKDAGNCTAVASVTIAAFENPNIDLGNDTTILKGSIAELILSTNLPVTGVKWSPFIQSAENRLEAFVKPDVTTTYSVEVKYGVKGCIITDSVTVFVKDEIAEVVVPNIFTPNGDGVNDDFYVSAKAIKNFNVKIFDRWGNKVFESFDEGFRWKGNAEKDGIAMPNGVFTYVIEYTELSTNKKQLLKGSITLLR